MKIEILEPGKMTQSGSSLLKLIQNNKTPSLDLFVREAVQNSLDAGSAISKHAESKKYVEVRFLTGDFCPAKLNSILESESIKSNELDPAVFLKFSVLST